MRLRRVMRMLLGLAGAVILVGVFAGGVAVTPWPSGERPVSNRVWILEPGRPWVQPIELTRSGLERIDVAMRREGQITGSLVLTLSADADGNQPLATAAMAAEAVEDTQQPIRRPDPFAAMRPAPQVSAGRYWLRLESAADRPVSVLYWERPDGSSTLTLRLYYGHSPTERWASFAERLAARPGALGRPEFYVVLVAAYGAVLALVLARLSRSVPGSG